MTSTWKLQTPAGETHIYPNLEGAKRAKEHLGGEITEIKETYAEMIARERALIRRAAHLHR